MVTMAQRIGELRAERNLSRPALAAALGYPRMAVEKFETGRQTPTQEQQSQLASYFGVSLSYLRGENNDRTAADDWMDGAFLEEPVPQPGPAVRAAQAATPSEEGTMLDALLAGKKFQQTLRQVVLEALRSPEGQEILTKVIQKELGKR